MTGEDDSSRHSVVLGYLHNFNVTSAFTESVLRTVMYERDEGTELLWQFMTMTADAMNLDTSRNRMVAHFLERSDKDWLWLLDTDIGFAPDTLARLYADAQETGCQVISGLYAGRFDAEPDGRGGFTFSVRPQLYAWEAELNSFRQPMDFSEIPDAGLLPVDGVGAGCLLVHRDLLERMHERYGTWFDLIHTPGSKVSEDLSFCLRAREMGSEILVDAGVRLSHQKVTWI